MNSNNLEQAYLIAKERYAELGVDAEAAMKKLASIPISLQCWQGDDVGGFETAGAALSGGGIQATGNYPGKARSVAELRRDVEEALSLVPGKHRLNLHASYLENGGKFVDRDAIGPEHFLGWIDWAKGKVRGLDFNPTYFSHPKAADGFTLSHPDKAIRKFWIEHGKRCRRIAAEMGKGLGTPAVTNVWIPDGFKDVPADRLGPRLLLEESLDETFSEKIDPKYELDAVESKLFGIGAESYTVGSHEFYLGYAVSRQKLLCLDSGHFHPTEAISDKISAVLLFVPELLLHVSRPVRWDSDHVTTLSDELFAIALETVRGERWKKIHIGLDFFDASINRVAAWVIGSRNALKALLFALLEPTREIEEAEVAFDFTRRLALLEELKTLPFGAVWDCYCERNDVPVGPAWYREVTAYEKAVLAKR